MIETLFFHTYYSYLRGDIQETKMYYELLREEFNIARKKDALDEYQLRSLKEVRDSLQTGGVRPSEWVSESSVPEIKSEESPDLDQRELVKKIHVDGIFDLKKYINADDLYLDNIEHPCRPYGRVDMVYRDALSVYPVEVKKDQGRHDLLGQIAKYTLFFKMNLHLKQYRVVQPITICREYDRHTLVELKRMNVLTFLYRVSDNRLTLGQV